MNRMKGLLARLARLRRPRLFTAGESFQLRTVAVLLLFALLPALALLGYTWIQVGRLATIQDGLALEQFRNEQTVRVRDAYALEQAQIASYAKGITLDAGGLPVAPPVDAAPAYVVAAYSFDPTFKPGPVLKPGLQVDATDMQTRLQTAKFSKDGYVEKWFLVDKHPYQFLFQRIIVAGSLHGYAVFVIDSAMLGASLNTTDTGFRTQLFDGEFNVLYASDPSTVATQPINDLTKRILAGNALTETYQGTTYAYGYADIGENPLYVSVSTAASPNRAAAASIQKFLLFILAFCLVLACVGAWKYVGSLRRHVANRVSGGAYDGERRVRAAIDDFLDESGDWEAQLEVLNKRWGHLRGSLATVRDDLGEGRTDTTPPADQDADATEPGDAATHASADD